MDIETDTNAQDIRETERRGPGRPRKEDSLRGAIRSKPIRERKRKGGQLNNPFDIPAHMIPDGTSYEWKRHTVFGKGDPSYDILMREQGWEPVDGSRHPELVVEGHKGAIIRDGMILMERPASLTEEARAEERAMAALVVNSKKEQLGQTPRGTLPRDAHPATRPSVRTSYESMPIDD